MPFRLALKSTAHLAALLALALSTAIPANADADGPDYFMVVDVAADDTLNLRAGPGIAHAVLAKIPHDADGLANLGCVGGLDFATWLDATQAERDAAERTRWCQIRYAGQTGWVAGWFLREGTAPE